MEGDDSRRYTCISKRLFISLFKITTEIVILKATKKLSSLICKSQIDINVNPIIIKYY